MFLMCYSISIFSLDFALFTVIFTLRSAGVDTSGVVLFFLQYFSFSSSVISRTISVMSRTRNTSRWNLTKKGEDDRGVVQPSNLCHRLVAWFCKSPRINVFGVMIFYISIFYGGISNIVDTSVLNVSIESPGFTRISSGLDISQVEGNQRLMILTRWYGSASALDGSKNIPSVNSCLLCASTVDSTLSSYNMSSGSWLLSFLSRMFYSGCVISGNCSLIVFLSSPTVLVFGIIMVPISLD